MTGHEDNAPDQEPDKVVPDARTPGPVRRPKPGMPGEEDRDDIAKAPGEGATW